MKKIKIKIRIRIEMRNGAVILVPEQSVPAAQEN
jgi:hypothetical protein